VFPGVAVSAIPKKLGILERALVVEIVRFCQVVGCPALATTRGRRFWRLELRRIALAFSLAVG
jgi:hypothetical protein